MRALVTGTFLLSLILLTVPVRPVHADEEPCRLSNAKIAVHVVTPVNKSGCSADLGYFGCQQFSGNPSPINTLGELGVASSVYLIALDIETDEGLKSIELAIDYNGVEGEGVDILLWTACSDSESPENGWPEPGGANTLSYDLCAGYIPDPTDPGGQGFAILGVFRVEAFTQDWFRLEFLAHREDPYPRIVDCDGISRLLLSVNLGSAAFGGTCHGRNPCVDHGDIFPAWCCMPDGSCRSTHPYCCDLSGGQVLWLTDCSSCFVPVQPTTWGRIKDRYR